MDLILIDYAVIGLLAGFLAGYLGIGGGLVIVPALSWLFARDPATADYAVHMAVATSLSTMLITSASSIYAHHRRAAILWPVALNLAPGLLAGAIAGALLAVRLTTDMLGVVFGIYVTIAGLQLLTGKEVKGHKTLPGAFSSGITGGVIGMISSLVGIGGGSMTVPWLLWHGREIRQSVATAAACGFPIALAGTVTFILMGQNKIGFDSAMGFIHLPAFTGVVIFSVLFAPLGAAAVHGSPPVVVRRIFGGFMLLVAWRMFFQG
jgi:uncharacterized membrane protein YfcA